jgi:hypothetical protein
MVKVLFAALDSVELVAVDKAGDKSGDGVD